MHDFFYQFILSNPNSTTRYYSSENPAKLEKIIEFEILLHSNKLYEFLNALGIEVPVFVPLKKTKKVLTLDLPNEIISVRPEYLGLPQSEESVLVHESLIIEDFILKEQIAQLEKTFPSC